MDIYNKSDLELILREADENLMDQFIEYHLANPRVFESFCKAANLMKNAGKKKYSARTIVELLRWQSDLVTTTKDFKINNHYSALYGRMLAYIDETFATFFSTRPLKTHKSSYRYLPGGVESA